MLREAAALHACTSAGDFVQSQLWHERPPAVHASTLAQKVIIRVPTAGALTAEAAARRGGGLQHGPHLPRLRLAPHVWRPAEVSV